MSCVFLGGGGSGGWQARGGGGASDAGRAHTEQDIPGTVSVVCRGRGIGGVRGGWGLGEGEEEHQTLAGLIPSRTFQEQ